MGKQRKRHGAPRVVAWVTTSMLVCGMVTGLAGTADSQGFMDQFGGFSRTSNSPIEIEADRLEVDDNKNVATFTGNVKAVQGDFLMQSAELYAFYNEDGEGGPGNSDLTKLEAKGKVLLKNGTDSSATSQWAVFDVKTEVVTIGGDVVLSQGKNVLRGEEVVIDLKTGRYRMVTSSTTEKGSGRIKGLFVPKQTDAGTKNPAESAAKSQPAKPNAGAEEAGGWSARTNQTN